MRVGIVGAGVSGLLCAQRLMQLMPSLHISVLEWGRGPGGRTARRRVKLGQDDGRPGELSFDHAAPYFTATTGAFREELARWEAAGVASPWPEAGEGVWVGVPSNHAIARHLVAGLEAGGGSMLFGHHVLNAEHTGAAWRVRATNRGTKLTVTLNFDALVLSDKLLLLPNTYAVLPPSEHGPLALPPSLISTGAIVMLIALHRDAAATAARAATATATPPAAAAVSNYLNHACIARVVHDSAKPGRGGGGGSGGEYDLWVVHSPATYAAAHLVGEALDDEGAVLSEMQAAFFELGGGELVAGGGNVAHASVMVWDHAQTTPGSRVLDGGYRLDADRRAGVCGDFFGGQVEGVEAAALSGIALADALALVCTGAKSDL